MNEDAFPDVRWGRDRPWVNKAATAFMSSRPGSWLFRKLVPLDRALLERSRGRYTMLGPIGVPLVLLNTVGRKSGERRTSPLTYMREDGRLLVVGSNFGSSRHPAWSWNLLANPEASVTIGGAEIPVVAIQLTGAERDRAFQKFVDYTRTYEEYTGGRTVTFACSPWLAGRAFAQSDPARSTMRARDGRFAPVMRYEWADGRAIRAA